jgi:hypothetical protein
MAELIENAIVFSPAHLPVEIRGRNKPEGGYTLSIIDAGVGMPSDALAASNRRLAGDESFTVAPSKYLGHYVAGHLAGRHGIAVVLMPGPNRRGTTAVVDLPATLLRHDLSPTDPLVLAGPVQGLPAGPPPPGGPDGPGSVPPAPTRAPERPTWWVPAASPAPTTIGGAYASAAAPAPDADAYGSPGAFGSPWPGWQPRR